MKSRQQDLTDQKLHLKSKWLYFQQEGMFNYFVLAPSPAYSLNSLPTQTTGHNDPPQEPQVSLAEYTKLLERYDHLKAKYDHLKRDNIELKEYVSELEDVFQPDTKRKKIKRRTQCQLSKDYACPYPLCKKEYASSLALNLHIRSKHNGGTKKERIAYIKQLLEAEEKGVKKPETSLSLCPQLLEVIIEAMQSELKSYRQKLQHVGAQGSKPQIKENASQQMGSDE